jgi:hypothetical protein
MQQHPGFETGRPGHLVPVGPGERIEHFVVMLGQLLDGALIGGVHVRLTLSDGRVIDGVPLEPASDPAADDELDDTGVRRWVELSGVKVDLADVRQAVIVHPASDA